jgi:hypothetical protein
MSPQTTTEHEIMEAVRQASRDLASRWADEMYLEEPLEYQLAFRARVEKALPQASRCRLQLGTNTVVASVVIYGQSYQVRYKL